MDFDLSGSEKWPVTVAKPDFFCLVTASIYPLRYSLVELILFTLQIRITIFALVFHTQDSLESREAPVLWLHAVICSWNFLVRPDYGWAHRKRQSLVSLVTTVEWLLSVYRLDCIALRHVPSSCKITSQDFRSPFEHCSSVRALLSPLGTIA